MLEGFSVTFSGLLQGGAVAILAYVFFMVVTGKLFSKAAVDRIIKEADDRVVREQQISQMWQAAHDSRMNEVIKLSEGLRDAIDGIQTVEHLIRAIRSYGEEGSHAPALEAPPRETR